MLTQSVVNAPALPLGHLRVDAQTRTRTHERRMLVAGLVATDVVMLGASVFLAGIVRLTMENVLPIMTLGFADRHAVASVVVVPLLIALFWMHGRYDLRQSLCGPREYAQIANASTYGVLVALAVSYFAGGEPLVSRSWLILVWLLSILCVSFGRFSARRVVRLLRNHGALHTRVVIVGASTSGLQLAEQFHIGGDGIDVVGFLDEYLPIGQVLMPGARVLGRPGDLATSTRTDIDEYILIPQALPHERLEEITRLMVSRDGPVVRMAVNSSDLLTHSLEVTERSNVPLLTLRGARLSGLDVVLKRIMDIAIAVFGLVLVAPAICAIALRARGRGVRKLLRSEMVYAAAGGKTKLWLLDPSVTTFLPLRGAPGLLSVLLGQFSLVGPRPIAWHSENAVQPAVWVTAVKPGLIGPWRLTGPSASLSDQAIEDLTYVRNYSIWEDLRILWLSILRVGHQQDADQLGRWKDRAQVQ